MSCGIHGWIEVKVKDKWIAVREIKDTSQNYSRFSALASVRGEGRAPKGVPDDVSDTCQYLIELYKPIAHSHSYMSISEAANIWFSTDDEKPDSFSNKYRESHYLGYSSEFHKDADARIVFWFDA